jgi:hypothetical protein
MKISKTIDQARHRASGMTLIEMVVASGVGTLILTAVAFLTMFGARSFVAMGNYGDLDRKSRNALDTLSREVRQSRALTAFTSTKLVFQDNDTNVLTYTYDATSHTLTRIKGTQKVVLLTGCDYLNFDISQRNPSNGFTFYPTTNVSTAKLIDVSWKCSRTILGAKVNTESVQTAKIVIRN